MLGRICPPLPSSSSQDTLCLHEQADALHFLAHPQEGDAATHHQMMYPIVHEHICQGEGISSQVDLILQVLVQVLDGRRDSAWWVYMRGGWLMVGRPYCEG